MTDRAPDIDLSALERRAETLEEVGALVRGGKAIRWARKAAEAALREWWTEELTISEAAEWSGYSEEYLRQLVADGRLPDPRKEARQGVPILVPRYALPRRPLHERPDGPRTLRIP